MGRMAVSGAFDAPVKVSYEWMRDRGLGKSEKKRWRV